MSKPKICFWDIETSPLQAWIWSPGKQFVGHKQLVKEYSRTGIICLAYCFNDGEPAKSLDWGYDEQDTATIVKQFDEIVKSVDLMIGKNSDRFDNKVLNASRMFAGLPGIPDWMRYTDDLEKQMRKYFRLPSQSLDYISAQLGFGGKIRMEMQDWIDICEKNTNGPTAFKKMIDYNKKDVEDTRALWDRLSEHFEPKFNMATYLGERIACMYCGSTNVRPNGSTISGKTRYKKYECNSCYRYAGRSPISDMLQKEGKIG